MQKCITEDWIDQQLLTWAKELVRCGFGPGAYASKEDFSLFAEQTMCELHGLLDFVDILKHKLESLPDAVEIKATEEKRE